MISNDRTWPNSIECVFTGWPSLEAACSTHNSERKTIWMPGKCWADGRIIPNQELVAYPSDATNAYAETTPLIFGLCMEPCRLSIGLMYRVLVVWFSTKVQYDISECGLRKPCSYTAANICPRFLLDFCHWLNSLQRVKSVVIYFAADWRFSTHCMWTWTYSFCYWFAT